MRFITGLVYGGMGVIRVDLEKVETAVGAADITNDHELGGVNHL